MAQFAVGKPITTEVPSIEVDAGLKPGLHRFSLTVVDAAGLRSRTADEVVVQITQLPLRPAGPVTPRTPRISR